MATNLKPLDLANHSFSLPELDTTSHSFTDGPQSRGAIGEIANQAKAGFTSDLPRMVGQAAQYASEPGKGLYEWGKGVAEAAEARGNTPENRAQPDQHNTVTNALASGARMLGPSIAPAAVAGGLLAAAPVELPALVGLGISSAIGAIPAAMSQGQTTLDKAKETGVPDDVAIPAARKTAAVEGLGETAGNLIGGKLFGLLGKSGGGLAAGGAAEKGVLKPFLKELPKAAAGEIATEMGQAGTQAEIERRAGIDTQEPWEAAKEMVAPTLGMTALLAPLGLAGRSIGARKQGQAKGEDAVGAQSPAQSLPTLDLQGHSFDVDPLPLGGAQPSPDGSAQASPGAVPTAPGVQGQDGPGVEPTTQSRALDPDLDGSSVQPASVDATGNLSEPASIDPLSAQDQTKAPAVPATNLASGEPLEPGQPQPIAPLRPSEAMGLNPAAGVLSRVAAAAVDSGVHRQLQDQKMQAQQAAPAQPAEMNLSIRPEAELRAQLREAQASGVRKAIVAELWRRRREAASMGSDMTQQSDQMASDGLANSLPTASPLQGLGQARGISELGPLPGQTTGRGAESIAPLTATGSVSGRSSNDQPSAPFDTSGLTKGGLAWKAFPPNSGTLNVPRADMPQIKAEHRGAMVNFLKARGIESTQEEIPAADLKPTQTEFSPAKVRRALGFKGGDRSILVSSDGHVLDGHHQWLAKLQAQQPVKVIRLDAPIAELMAVVKEFPSATASKGATPATQPQPQPVREAVPASDEQLATQKAAPTTTQPQEQLNGPQADQAQQAEAQPPQEAGAQSAAVDAGPAPLQGSSTGAASGATEGNLPPGSTPAQAAPAFLSPRESAARIRSVMRVEQVVKNMTQKWAAAPKITVVHDLSDPRVPEGVRALDSVQRSGGANSSPEGVYSADGEVFLMAGQLPTANDVARVLAHEVLGHHGLRQYFGDSLDSVLRQIVAMRSAQVKAKIQEYGLQGIDLRDQLIAAEEVLAEMAQAQPTLGFVRRAVAAIRTWLRQHVPGFKGMTLSDAEIIHNYLLPAREYVQRGVASGAINGIPAFSREGEGFTPTTRSASTFDQARTVAKEFQGKTLHNAAAGMDAVISRNSLDKMLSAKAVGKSVSVAAHVHAVANADRLFERAVLVDSHPDGKEHGTITAVHRFYAPMRFGGKTLQVKLTVKEFAQKSNGNRVYTVEAMDLASEDGGAAPGGLPELPQVGVGGAEQGPVAHQPSSSAGQSVAQGVGKGKPGEKQGPAFSRAKASAWIDDKLNVRPETIVGDTGRKYTAEQLQAMRNVGMQVQEPSLLDRAKALYQDAGKKLAQGIVDQFAPVKDLDKKAYLLLRLSKGATGAFEAFLRGGRLKLSNGVYDFDGDNKGGVVDRLLMPLGGEHHDFFRWVAANRAERLMAEGKENLFTPADIQALKSLSEGQTSFDYIVQHGPRKGKATRSRAEIYRDSLVIFNQFNKNILDMAEQSGLIDGASRKVWESEFYVPFYRVADDIDGGVRGMNVRGGVLRQQAFKALKGGKAALSADLLDNTLMNWAHLLDASAKNRGAKATLEAAARMGVAIEASEEAVRDMGKSMGLKSGAVWFMDQGQKRHFLVEDPYLLTALNSLEYAGMKNPMMNAMGAFKHALTVGVTASPFFKIRNLIRDSVQVIGTSPISYNPAANIAQGWKLTDPKSDAYFRLLAGGGTIHFGTMVEGSEAKRLQRLVEAGVDKATILDSEHKVQAFYRRFVAPGIEAYNELGNRGEAVNRAALYGQLIKQGVGHDEASLMARDLMDFSMQGSFTSIRFLTQVVPFLNARLQGLYKLGKSAKEDPARFGVVLGATAVVSLGLLAAYADDDDWKKREDWDRNNYWWFKFGGTAFRIPKPFEIGSIATLAERGFELAFDKEMTTTRFRKQVLTLMGDQLSMNPVPQLVKPILDVYANKDSFSGRPIETMGMEKLKPEYRFHDRTTMAARATSTAANAVTGLIGIDGPSPVQIDHMLQGYFGWLGTMVVSAADVVARPATGQNERASPDYWKVLTGSMASDLRDAPSRYVSQMYAQAKELEEVHGTWQHLIKERRLGEAAEFRADHHEELQRYRRVENVKRVEARLNQQIRSVERSDLDPDVKQERIRALRATQDRVARQLNPA